ncbi:MAG: GntR family transcriptional regulator, partial [Nitrospirota bacterium]
MQKTKTINRETHEKLYAQLYKILRRKIEAGEWASGLSIPSEKEICRTYEVSAATVKTAVAHLVNQGFLVRRQGKGTFVTDWKRSGGSNSGT